MYVVIYLFAVPSKSVPRFLELQAEESVIYRRYGALSYDTFPQADLSAKFGTSSIRDGIDIRKGEELILEIDTYVDKRSHDLTSERIDNDERTREIYEEISRMFEISRVRRGEFGC